MLTADSDYKGGTIISAGTLQLGNRGATGSIKGNVTNDGTLAFARSGIYQFDGAIAGSGNVTQTGPGTTVLTGASSYTGLTNIDDGTLEIAAGGAVASGLTSVASGAHLQVDGKLTAPVSVNGFLQGEGTIAGAGNLVEINNGGTLNILDNNNGIQKLTIEGDLTVYSGGNLNYNYGLSPVPGDEPGVLMLDVGGDVKLGGKFTVACTPPVCGGAGGGVLFADIGRPPGQSCLCGQFDAGLLVRRPNVRTEQPQRRRRCMDQCQVKLD